MLMHISSMPLRKIWNGAIPLFLSFIVSTTEILLVNLSMSALAGTAFYEVYRSSVVIYSIIIVLLSLTSMILKRINLTAAVTFLVIRMFITLFLANIFRKDGTILFLLASGFLLDVAIYTSIPYSVAFVWLSEGLFFVLMSSPQIFGNLRYTEDVPPAQGMSIQISIIITVCASFLFLLLRYMIDQCREKECYIEYLSSLNDDLAHSHIVESGVKVSSADIKALTQLRRQITREFHDTSGYIFTGITALLNIASMADTAAEMRGHIEKAKLFLGEGLKQTKQLLLELREDKATYSYGINTIIKMVQQFEDITKIKTELKIGQIPFQIPSKIEYMLYRIIQESLTNAFRHGRPTLIEILIRMEGSAIKVSVRDNGQGTLRKGTGIGITGMEERIHELDGKLFLNKTANGTQLDIHIPVFFTAM